MLNEGSQFFLYLPEESSQRILHPATVTSREDQSVTAALQEDDLPIEPGTEAFIYFEHRRTFMQQPVRIEAVLPPEEQPDGASSHDGATEAGRPQMPADDPFDAAVREQLVFAFQTTGEAVSAENRQCYRVSTVVASAVSAELNDQQSCPVLDVSATGFSVLCDAELRPGQVVRTKLEHEQQQCSGTAIVQSAKELPDGRTRYGMYCAGNEKSNGDLLKGLQRISASLQRQQLRRMTGTGG